MKHLFYCIAIIFATTFMFSCNPTGTTDSTPTPTTLTVLEGEITSNRTLDANQKYLLKNFVYVKDGATLTIPAGTVIFGDKDTKGTLVVEQGGKLIANGTAARPIIFTSNRPRGQRSYGDWGGVVLIGKAPHNQVSSTIFEGGIRGSYGALNVPNDDSGILRYVRIEFAGVALGSAANSEINGLTLYGVGSATTIEYVQVSYSGDDSFEWFGGTVNCKYLIAHRGFDDDFDTDHGYTGKVQFGVSLRDPSIADASTSNGFESDNFNLGTPATGPNAGLPLTQPIFANMSCFVTAGTPSGAIIGGSGGYGRGMHLRRNTACDIYNSVMVGYPEGLRLDGSSTYTNATTSALELRGVVLANMTKDLAGTTTTVGQGTDAEVAAYFNSTNPNRMNQIVSGANLSTLMLNANNFNLTTPNFLPQMGSPLLTGAATLPADPFFTTVTYRGAFGTMDWTTGWTNFDPQNTDY
ncbi:MAG: cell shape-determining protein MreB [Bacteroidetes bacterium]|nr:MAG: cell shape-determining protein MreB [Bacteroidota bacterium]TAG88085.1 MAG: cell shape-determining protein MreB [Bacteroidota bacterium]